MPAGGGESADGEALHRIFQIFQKIFGKGIDKRERGWYIMQAVRSEARVFRGYEKSFPEDEKKA